MRPLLFIFAALVTASAHASVLEVKVQGLNCALCSEEMRSSLVSAAQASAIEPKLECGVIFVQTEKTPTETEVALRWPLTANGFNLQSVEVSSRSMEQARSYEC